MKTIEINTLLNYKISLTEFSSKNSNDIVIICSATGVLQGYYSKFAKFLQENNFIVYTFDYGGIGASNSQNLKKFDTSLTNWAINDIESIFQFIKNKHPQATIHCVCHSIGGQILGLVPSNYILRNVILVASQSGYPEFWKGFSKMQMYFNWYILFPLMTSIFGYLPSKKITGMENLPKSMAREFASWGRKSNYLFHYKKKNELYHHQIDGNLASYSTNNDNFAPKESIDWMTKKYFSAKITRKHLLSKDYNTKNIGHFGFFKSKFKDSIWQEFLSDLQA